MTLRSCLVIIAFSATLTASMPARSQGDVAAELCNAAGVCAPVEPVTALIIIGIKTIGDEINKGKDGFGPNGVVIKAVNTVLGDLRRGGLGPNNDLVKAWETMRNDILHGMGKNNDILKLLNSMKIKL
jgi:hypothetical protein